MSTRGVVDHHLGAFGAGNVEDLLADYDDASVFISPKGIVRGLDGLRALFEELFAGLFAPGTYDFTMDAMEIDGEVALLAWHATCAGADVPFAADTFLVRDGRIAVQTFAAQIVPT